MYYSPEIYIYLFFSLTSLCVSDGDGSVKNRADGGGSSGGGPEIDPKEEFAKEYEQHGTEILHRIDNIPQPLYLQFCQKTMNNGRKDIKIDHEIVGWVDIPNEYARPDGVVSVFPILCTLPGSEAFFCLSSVDNKIYLLTKVTDGQFVFQRRLEW